MRQQGLDLDSIFLDYGQAAANFEGKAVAALARHLGLPIQHFALTGSKSFGSGELVGRNAFLIFASLFLTGGRSGLIA